MALQRHLTGTPLARLFAQDVAGTSTHRRPDIPWEKFDRRAHPDGALEVAYDAMRWLASGEYAAVEGFSRMCAAFSWHGVPYDLIAACARVPHDELRHSEMALRAAARLRGVAESDVAMPIEGRRPAKPRDVRMPLRDLDVDVALVPAMLETIAASLLTEGHRRARDPMMKSLYASILADEIHHARLGWYYLAWRAPQWTRPERQYVADAVASCVVRRGALLSDGREAPRGQRRALDALGVMTAETQHDVVRRAMEDEIVPAFDALGLGMSHAWKASALRAHRSKGRTGS
jgi:hypothetical protein